MNNFLQKFKPSEVLKASGVLLLVVLIAALAVRLLGSSFGTLLSKNYPAIDQTSMGYGGGGGYAGYDDYGGVDGSFSEGVIPELSARNIAPAPSYPRGTTGGDAEEYEVSDYSSTIETRNLSKTCEEISGLKALGYVIFESTNESDRYCNYTFKAEKDREEEVLSKIKEFNPRELVENTYTIKNVVEDYTNELEILTNKLEVVDETLDTAIGAYDEITRVAINTNDAEALAKIIDSKIKIIERLTQQKIEISSQIDRLQRSKAQQLDRLDYVYFHVSVYENKIIDGQALQDSWKRSLREFVREINKTIQDLSVNLLIFILSVLQVVIYLVIALFVAKYMWRWAKNFWKNK